MCMISSNSNCVHSLPSKRSHSLSFLAARYIMGSKFFPHEKPGRNTEMGLQEQVCLLCLRLLPAALPLDVLAGATGVSLNVNILATACGTTIR